MATGGQHALGRGLERLPALCAAGCDVPDHVSRFYFLRHGQTARNALRIYQSIDEPLNATGLAQAEQAALLLAAEFAGSPLVHIVCSDAPRARTTAQAVARQLQHPPVPHAGLRERHFGALIGTSSADIDWDCAPEGGETLDQFVARTLAALTEAIAQPGPVLIVAHGGTLHVLAAALGVGAHAALLANAQPLRFDREGEGWRVTPLGAAQPACGAVNLA
ncbi:histidine phosphatase family protein [Pseudorhodoferax sp. Leaf267]|uniref:histidine phosphatase family protein n=1 Tax=Pseudorhodoferax sp. Leaf267 TaxID=1736316 RepID=UPI0006F6908F|nr:histidine phosphatase family protein [Pseudorhodoferax sp. Leaf267]KQP22052.1 phosphoglycerate mutase [Pseudorhodoferax sp. Leaf267]